jgi:hypothetical protein
MPRKFLLLTLLLALLSLGLSACGGQSDVKMAPLHQMSPEVRQAPVTVQQAYQFAVANPEVTQAIPCYCGCGNVGHTSNYACYVQDVQDGQVLFDAHALGCSICVDITIDAMRMTADGKSLDQIKSAIDYTYAPFGPSNMDN